MTQRAITRTVELLAWKFNGEPIDQLPEWIQPHAIHVSSVGLALRLSDELVADVRPGDWVTKELGGGLGACTAKAFHEHYQMLSGDANAVELRMQSRMFQPGQWNPAIVERASVAYWNESKEEPDWIPWERATESDKQATRLAIRKALTAAISTGF